MSDFVELRGGLMASTEALALGCDLEARGHALSVSETTGKLMVSRSPQLTAADRAAIPPLVRHLKALATYRAHEAV